MKKAGNGARRPNYLARFLNLVEMGGNALPHPAILFALMALLAVVLSGIAAGFHLEVQHPGTGKLVQPVSLLSIAGLHRMLTSMVSNFTGFAPLGTVLVAMLGIGVLEGSGFIGSLLRLVVIRAPRQLLTFAVVFSAVLSHAAGEMGYVLLIPLAAAIFHSAGRHPLAGLAAAFAGVSGGYSANFFLGTLDPLLAGLTQEAARVVDSSYLVSPACNYYFMSASALIIAVAGTWVTERFTIPRLGAYGGGAQAEEIRPLSEAEKKGLRMGLLATGLLIAIVAAGAVPSSGFLREPVTGSFLRSPFLASIVTFIFLAGVVGGAAYGIGAGTVRRGADVVKMMGKSMETLSGYLVLVFFAAQFVAYFNWTNLGLILAVEGAELLRALGLGHIPLMLALVLLAAFINMFMGSASAKWAILAPVFVPMFMLLGYTPELTQTAYRIGDSVTNVISPMMTYFPLIVAFAEKYDKQTGIGTVIALMLPYSVTFGVVWSLLLTLWLAAGLPVGPGAGLLLAR